MAPRKRTASQAFEEHLQRASESSYDNGANGLTIEEQAVEGMKDFRKSLVTARKVASRGPKTVECPRVKRGEKDTSMRPRGLSSDGQRSSKVRKATKSKKVKEVQPVWVPPRSDGQAGPARRKRLLLKFRTANGRVEYAELLDVIERMEEEKDKLKLKVNFKEGTIRTRWSVSSTSKASRNTETSESVDRI